VSTKGPTAPRSCLFCGAHTRGRIFGHAVCVAHYREAELLLTSRDRAFEYGEDGGVVLGAWDLDALQEGQPLATVAAEAVPTPAGGRVLLRVVTGDRAEGHAAVTTIVLRPRTADTLADYIEAAGNQARTYPRVSVRRQVPEPVPAAPDDLTQSEGAADAGTSAAPNPSGDSPGEEPRK
jgi:hypothetical protein